MMDVDFRCERVLAQGGGGLLFRAELINDHIIQRNQNDRLCTVKIVKGNRRNTHFGSFKRVENENMDEELRNGFLQEVALMWLFVNSKNFAKVGSAVLCNKND